MKLLVMRHGEAKIAAESDHSRNLTEAGQNEIRNQCDHVRKEYPDLIISSPLIRAQQTAGIVKAETSYQNDIFTWEELSPSGEPDSLVGKLQNIQFNIALLTSHQPLVSRLVEYLCNECVSFDTGQIACIAGEIPGKHCCRLIWLR